MINKRLIALLIPFAVLASGCDIEGDGDNVSIENNFNGGFNGGTNGGTNGGNGGGGSCDDVPTADFVEYNDDCSEGLLTGTIDMDWTLTSDISWQLSGTVQVGNGNQEITSAEEEQAIRDAGVTLTVEAGTHVRAFDTGSLLVTRGSWLIADGTATNPITFSSIDNNFDGLGEWGGIIIQGFAPQYGQGGTGLCANDGETWCNVEGEGGTDVSVYGGTDPADNSGTLRYVRVAEGGLVAGPNNEINGITLQGVGHGTVFEYIQVHGNLDDGIEWFGGTVNLRYAVLTNNDDDDLDYDEGSMINVQNVIIRKHPNKASPTGSNDPRAIEANSSDDEYTPETEATLANITIIGSALNNDDSSEAGPQPGMRLRGAVTTGIYNSSVSGFDVGCARIDDADVDGDDTIDFTSDITLVNFLADCRDGIYNKRAADTETNVWEIGLSYDGNLAIEQDEAQLGSATSIPATNNGSGFVFDSTDYVGAVDPNGPAWWMGWTLPDTVTAAEQVMPADFVSCNADETVCTLEGLINEDYTLVAGVEWRLQGEVLVGEGNAEITSVEQEEAIKAAGVTLTIRPGVHVRAFDTGSLLVTRGSQLWAVGTAQSPITFSSLTDENFDGEGEWGGVILQGFAPQYGQGGTGVCFGEDGICNVEGEGGTVVGNYGGDDPADSSGALMYVRIAEGGLVAGPNNEINGLTLQGVGHGTQLEYIQVHNNLDDAVEWFGGTANARFLVLTNNDDDSLDVDEGYMGNIQHVIIRMNPNKDTPTGSNDPRGIEANSSDDEYVPETNVNFANILILGSGVNNNEGAGQQPGARLRGAITAGMYNSAVRDFDTGCIRVDDADVNGDGTLIIPSDITLVNVIGECEDGFYDKRDADTVDNAGPGTVTVDGAYALTDGAAIVGETAIPAVDNGSGFTFENTSYVGAVEPGTAPADTWWADWIIEGSLD